MNKRFTVRKLVLASLFAALTFAATLIHIHFPGMMTGYVNTGDCMVIISALLLGPIYGASAAAIGSAFTDLFHGYVIYVPATFVIKFLMAFAAYYIYVLISKKKLEFKIVPTLISGIVAEAIMVAGYFLYEALFIVGIAGAAAGIYGNCVQGLVCLVIAAVLLKVLKKTNITKLI